jgi:hypothetical protein
LVMENSMNDIWPSDLFLDFCWSRVFLACADDGVLRCWILSFAKCKLLRFNYLVRLLFFWNQPEFMECSESPKPLKIGDGKSFDLQLWMMLIRAKNERFYEGLLCKWWS